MIENGDLKSNFNSSINNGENIINESEKSESDQSEQVDRPKKCGIIKILAISAIIFVSVCIILAVIIIVFVRHESTRPFTPEEIIGEIKKDIKNYDSKYKKYIEFLEYSLKFKKACIDDNYIHYSEIEPYSNTVGDCMLKACKKEKYNWVEGQNKNLDYSNKKLHLMKFRALLEMNNSPAIDAILEKTTLKKLGLTPLNMGEMYYDYKLYNKATEYLIQVKEKENLSYVIELLRSMNKYKEALEIIISDKDNEAKGTMVNEILHKDPSLKYYVDELCVKYKVYLG